jgi:hypothetical protein
VGVFGGLMGLVGEGGVGVGVLVGDPGEQFGLVGQQCGVFGGVAAEDRRGLPGESVQELGDLVGGDRGAVAVSHGGARVWSRGRQRGRRAGR